MTKKHGEAFCIRMPKEEVSKSLKEIWEDETIKKIGIDLTKTYILLKQIGIDLKGIDYDVAISSYILNPTNQKLAIENLIEQYLEIDLQEWMRRRNKTTTNNLI